jgi:hypothetical protein
VLCGVNSISGVLLLVSYIQQVSAVFNFRAIERATSSGTYERLLRDFKVTSGY